MDDFMNRDIKDVSNIKKVMKDLLTDVDKIAEKEKEKKINWIIGIISHLISLISMGAVSRLEAFSKISLLLKIIAAFNLENVPIIKDMLFSLKAAFDRRFGVKFDLFKMMDSLFFCSGKNLHFLFEDISSEDLMKNEQVKDLFYDSFLWHSKISTSDDGKKIKNKGLKEINEFLEGEEEYKKEKDLEEYYMKPRNSSFVSEGQFIHPNAKKKMDEYLEENQNINFTV